MSSHAPQDNTVAVQDTELLVYLQEKDHSSKRARLTVAILLLINLLNYMDRFTIAGTNVTNVTNITTLLLLLCV